MTQETQKKRDLKNILLVLIGAVLCAGLLSFWFIHHYGPSGEFVAGNALLDPQIIERLNYGDRYNKENPGFRFMFDNTEFSYYNSEKNKTEKNNVPLDIYKKIYKLVDSDVQINNITNEIKLSFIQKRPALLQTYMKEINYPNKPLQIQTFQVVQFSESGYYRVQIYPYIDQEEWVYFHHPDIYQKVIQLFVAPTS